MTGGCGLSPWLRLRTGTVLGSIHPTVDTMGRPRCGMLAFFPRVSHCPGVLAHLRGSLMSERQEACLVFRARLTCPHLRTFAIVCQLRLTVCRLAHCWWAGV